jgi:glycine cleavage system aminomethyltransferase T
MGYVQPRFAGVGGQIQIDIRGNAVPAVIVERPFYRKKNVGA